MDSAAVVFSTLAEPIRLRALVLIAKNGELCVCEVMAALDLPQPKISRHLAVMRNAGLVRDRREAQWVFYALAPDMPAWMSAIIKAGVAAVERDAIHIKDAKRLSRADRPARIRCQAAV